MNVVDRNDSLRAKFDLVSVRRAGLTTDERHGLKGVQEMSDRADRLRELVSDVAAAYFSNTHVSPTEIAGVLDQIATSLGAIGEAPAEAEAEAAGYEPRLTPAQIRNSVKPDGIVSFEDGKSYKTLRRHLSSLGMTPPQYLQKWGLPSDYPMVAPNLSAMRSELARSMRLGQTAAAAQEPISGSRRKPREKQLPR
jgi:predicted transcriptional regulator